MKTVLLTSLVVIVCCGQGGCILRTTLEEINSNGIVNKFATLIRANNLTHYFDRPGITVFVPVSSVYSRFLDDAKKYGYNLTDPATIKSVLLYHIGEGTTTVSDMEKHDSTRTLHPNQRHVYFNNYNYGDTKVFTVNGAWIVGSDILASNGMVHIIDRFLIPVQSNKTVAEYLEQPELPNFAFQSIKNASVIDPALKMATNSTASKFTVFAPNDSYITVMPAYGQDVLFNDTNLLKSVFWAHVIEEGTLYIPRLGEIPDSAAMAGILKFDRIGTEIFVSSNKVRARIIQPNIPVRNGVIHVVDDLLFYIYRNMRQKIDVLKNSNFVKAGLFNVESEIRDMFTDTSRKMTFFLPSDEALAKLPSDRQSQLDTNATKLSKFFRDHLIVYAERDLDSFQDGETFTTSDGEILTMRKVNDNVYVEGGGVRAKLTIPNLGCTNGVIHLVNSVLFQRDFTIWEAIQGNSQLSRMEGIVSLNASLMSTLHSTSNGPMTAFLISDAAIDNLKEDTLLYLKTNVDLLLQAIRGSIAHGFILSSTQISDEQDVPTLSGRTITLYNTRQGLYVIGSKIRANVVIEDIWCSNGILHIVDNIIHLPTRNIVDEMSVHPSLTVMSGLMEMFQSLSDELKDVSTHYTMFVPSDDAFTSMPTHRARVLSETQGLLHSIIRCHIVPGTSMYMEKYGNYTRLTSHSGLPLFVLKSQDQVHAVSNNLKGTVVESNIRCMNGIIHIVDTLLNFPFWTVEEVMEKTPELKQFYGLVQQVEEFNTWSSTLNINQTLFVPSTSFLQNLKDYHQIRITTESGMVKKLYESHMIPALTLNQEFLEAAFRSSRMYLTENRYNHTFTLIEQDTSNRSELVSVDTGYTNLVQRFDLVFNGYACCNGIIYTIDGFLNYPLHDTLVEIKRQPKIGIGTDQLLKLIPHNAGIDLTSRNTVFTVFAPDDDSFNYLTFNDITYINQNLTFDERMEIVERHIVIGQQIEYRDIIDGRYTRHAYDRNISVISKTDAFYLRWENVEAKIVRPNILATNGVIHVVDRLLLSTPYQMTTLPPTTTQKQQVSSSTRTGASLSAVFISCILAFVRTYFDTVKVVR
ncbi:fasciclin-1-like [Mercenaria mercenaria]|uniref:fasciclin-1-like n=1 Tax=Mercenaria mercenaria TaxID=6596 RepID=UPI00234F83D6|nr:fasciclin-1-like [Mercenaria mercenaria]